MPETSSKTSEFPGTRFERGTVESVADRLAVEAPLQVKINGKAFTITMRTPGEDELLVRGLLHTEGVLLPDSDDLDFKVRRNIHTQEIICIDVTVPDSAVQREVDQVRTFASTSSCGLCGSKEMPETKDMAAIQHPLSDEQLEQLALPKMMLAMRESQSAFSHAGGTHAAGVFTTAGDKLAVFEDIGRHNAVDKIVGWQLMNNVNPDGKVLTVSGRISYEIVLKAWRADFSAIAGVSAPSTLAVEMGKQSGVAIFGFCRDERATLYSCATMNEKESCNS